MIREVKILAQSKVTLIGLESYLNPEHSVFENATFPEGIEKEVLMGAIFLRCQEFELLYSDPDFMIAAVNIWARKHYWTFDKWVKLLSKEYDPLYNKDYYEDIRDTHEGASSGSGSNSQTDSYTNSRTDKHSEKAYNTSSGYNEIMKDESNGSNGGTTSGTFSNSGNDSYVNGHTYHGYGNIGITSAQELFLKEVDVGRFNLYEQIADLFCNEFCIMVF
jgi:hypothetical protein